MLIFVVLDTDELSISKTFIVPSIIEEELASPSDLIPFALMEVVYMGAQRPTNQPATPTNQQQPAALV